MLNNIRYKSARPTFVFAVNCMILRLKCFFYIYKSRKLATANFKDSLYNPLYSVGTIGNKSDRPTRAARTMSLFVLVFIIQWGAAAVYGAWTMLDDHIPLEIVFPVMAFSSLGGLLNGIVYLNMRIKSKRWNTTAAVTMISTKQTTAAPLGDPGNSRQLP